MKTTKSILTHTVSLEIPFFDVDAMNIAWHGHYIKYFEVARCALLDEINYDYQEMKDSGYAWPVVDVRVKYIQPCHFKQKIQVQAALIEYENRLKIQYTIIDEKTEKKLTLGYSVQVAVNLHSQEMCFASPQILLDKLKRYL